MGRKLDYQESSGSVWEYFIARFLSKKIYTSDYLLGLSLTPNTWRTETRAQKLKKLLENRS